MFIPEGKKKQFSLYFVKFANQMIPPHVKNIFNSSSFV